MTHTPQKRKCLLCPAPVFDQAALCPDCERNLEDHDSPVRAVTLDALVQVRREPTRAQREGRR